MQVLNEPIRGKKKYYTTSNYIMNNFKKFNENMGRILAE
jgi:hypothetical protein